MQPPIGLIEATSLSQSGAKENSSRANEIVPEPLRTWPIRLLKPRTCDAYPSLHDTWPEDRRRWHMTKALDFTGSHVTQEAEHRS
ncbi:hypothetical protein NC651_021806 [Populus alba x Populus x berolinensis]|nr:hypothetical protein NC651_021806 [Populus alba x Populus x berolinensis]